MRIPYPKKVDSTGWYKINDFYVLHFNYAFLNRLICKNRFYQCTVRDQERFENAVTLFRTYSLKHNKIHKLPSNWLSFTEDNVLGMLELIDFDQDEFWYDIETLRMFEKDGIDSFRDLNIWDKNFLQWMESNSDFRDPRGLLDRLLHIYLNNTSRFSQFLIIRIADKLIRRFMSKRKKTSFWR